MKYIIMANGKSKRWNNYNNIPKQMIEINGETLLQRTVRLLKKYDASSSIIITSKDERCTVNGAVKYEPLQDSLEIDRYCYELIEPDICFLYGDTYYTNYAIKKIVKEPTKDLLFFGNEQRIFAVKVNDAALMKRHIDNVKKLFQDGVIKDCIGWQLYQSFMQLGFAEKKITDNYVLIHDITRDFNYPKEYKVFIKLLNRKKKFRRIKGYFLKIYAFLLVLNGFTRTHALQWLTSVYRDFRKQKSIPFRKKIWAYRHGFLSWQVEEYGIAKDNLSTFISQKDYRYIMPLNGKYNKWINNCILSSYIFTPFSDYLTKHYYQLTTRDRDRLIIRLPDCPSEYGDSIDDILNLIKTEKISLHDKRGESIFRVNYAGDTYRLDNSKICVEDLKDLLFHSEKTKRNLLVSEHFEPVIKFKMIAVNQDGSNPIISDAVTYCTFPDAENNKIAVKINLETGMYYYKGGENKLFKGTIPDFETIKNVIKKLCLFVPQIEFMCAKISITKDGFKITGLTGAPGYFNFSEATTAYLLSRVVDKKKSQKGVFTKCKYIFSRIKLRIRRRFTKLLYPKGMLPYLGTKWISMVSNDFFVNRSVSFIQKMWAYTHGFLSYRLEQYGITEENHLDYISDYEYLWLRHINSKYRVCFEDKITVKYIVSDYKECFPEYYYHIMSNSNKNKVIPMMDCPEGYTGSYDDIFKLVKLKKILALKPDEGSHGEGFFKFTYSDDKDKLFLNSEEVTEDRVRSLLEDVNNQYIITEYIQMHSDIKKIYNGAVNTIRMIVFKKDGRTPEIGNAYMRFGSKKTGAVDNMGAGGIFAQIDIDTGRYHNAKIIENNDILPCEYHPDTGVKIEGLLPNWEKVKCLVLEVAKSVPQLEYFGFDIALTEDGLKFPEINRFPDYPKIEKLGPKTMDYLLYKLNKKKELYEYDINRPRKLINLPKR